VSAGVASLSPAALSFAAQLIGTVSGPQTVTLSNTGGSPFTVGSIALSGPQASDFQISNTCGTSVAAGAHCAVTVTFTPTAAGTRSATLLVTDSAAGSPQSVPLSGMGVSAGVASLSPAALSFAAQLIGTVSGPQTVTLSNTGGSPFTVGSIALSGSQASDFQVSNTCETSVAAGAHCAVTVTFTPTAAGTRSATLLVTDSAAGSPQSVPLSGTALGAAGRHP
jgi:hypothetical protein